MAFAPVKWLRFRYEVEAMLYRVSQDIPENFSEKLIIILNIVIFLLSTRSTKFIKKKY